MKAVVRWPLFVYVTMRYYGAMNHAVVIQEAIARALQKLEVSVEPAAIMLEHATDLAHGDYASNIALVYAKQLGMKPHDLAEHVAVALRAEQESGALTGVSMIEVAGPGFINFTLAPDVLAGSLDEARTQDMWGANDTRQDKKIMVEYTDPNPFKEFHIGHLMANATGESISRLVQFSGADVKRACYQGDVGLHVAKAIWGKSQKPDASWGEAYVYGTQQYDAHKDEVSAINKQVYERSDADINTLYDDGRTESLEHFEEIYKILGTKFDHYFFESKTGVFGKEIVEAYSDVFEKSDGAIVYKGDESKGLHTRVFINSEGLPTYEAKELGLAKIKYDTYPYDTSIVITANEVNDYFRVLLDAMARIFPDLAAKTVHISHGMMRFAEGKMSSRTGNVITGESLLGELTEAAKARATESRADDHEKLAEQIAVAAIKYQILKQGSNKDIIFDKERALSLEGDSGPYLQYTYARTCAILLKAREQHVESAFDVSVTPNDVMRIAHRFPDIVARASRELQPHLVAQFLLQVASAFNSWYAQEQILDGTPAAAHKVAIVEAVNHTLKNGLWLLGIEAPEKM